ncbi:lytic transglycosylase domain-containing protein [Hyalangium sp.]|uniref:lytic transglycosylase domain-containing protein n=1 Tax=Hyalangium sp. TaxID=2028555 RepID=UPI002D40A9FC|nr:lytic transglycosylase domain-containing protein [Hyalangium sp.]HYH97652.1 lytic transglycosylase domain-containing protein [Hyalangium sp.]
MNVSPLRQNPTAARLQTHELSSTRLGDGFQGLQGRGGQLQALLEGAKALMDSINKIQKLMQLTQGGGVQKGGASPSAPAPFSQSSFTPCGGKAPVELNPAGKSGSSPVSPSGDAKLGAGMPPALEKYKGAIESASAKTGVPASMLAAQIWQESRGNLSATSTNGGNGLTDTGLMQINPNTFKELQAKHPELQGKDLADPETNILAGACYMKDMKEQFGSWDLALRAYNSGPNGVDRSNVNALPAGTGDATYVQKVKQFWDTIATGKGSLPA